MAYARFGGGSDVYVLHHVGGYMQCCGCKRGRVVFKMGVGTWSPHRDTFKWLMSRGRHVPFKNRIRHKEILGQKEIPKTRLQRWREIREGVRGREMIIEGAKRDGKRVKKVAYFVTCSTDTPTRSEMIAHLEYHRALGDSVPQYAIDRLTEEIAKYGDAV